MDIQTTQTLYILPLQDRCYERPKITLNHHDTNVRQMYFSASDAQIFFQIVCSNVHTLLFFSIRKLIHWIVTKKLFDNFIMLVILVGKGSATYFIQIKIFIVLFSLSLLLSFYSQNSAFRLSPFITSVYDASVYDSIVYNASVYSQCVRWQVSYWLSAWVTRTEGAKDDVKMPEGPQNFQ